MKRLALIAWLCLFASPCCAKSPNVLVLKPGDAWNFVPYHESMEPKTPEQWHQLAVAFWTDYLCAHPELVPVIREALPAGERQLEYIKKWYPKKQDVANIYQRVPARATRVCARCEGTGLWFPNPPCDSAACPDCHGEGELEVIDVGGGG